ncbi:MFS general substrate transporter [Lichtheimia hyalospora FSU 10163]|nr:MFS general substrate transporter [Lichtheimia hyalospora FSU 10163]
MSDNQGIKKIDNEKPNVDVTVLHEETVSEEDQKIKKRALRKITLHVLFPMSALYFMNYLDRGIIGNAKLGGIIEDLNMTSEQYNWCLSIFYFGYVLADIPSNLMMRHFNGVYWISFLAFMWGSLTMVVAAVTNYAGLMALRLFLGTFEAGFMAGALYFFAKWFTRRELGQRLGYYYSFASLGAAVGGLIAYGISTIPTHTLNTWQWLFLIEGCPAILLSLFILWFVPSTPETAKCLNEGERRMTIKCLLEDHSFQEKESFSWATAVSVLREPKLYLFTFMMLVGLVPSHGTSLALPSLVDGMGNWSKAESQALTTPPYIIQFITSIVSGWISEKWIQRGYQMILTDLFGVAGFLMLVLVPHHLIAVRYFAVCLAMIGTSGNTPVKAAWYTHSFAGLSRRAVAVAIVEMIGNVVGGVIGGQIYYDPPNYTHGNAIALGCHCLRIIGAIGMRLLLSRENKRRDKMTPEEKEREIAKYGGEAMAGDRHPDYRYVL